jgi:cytoskeletal protein CcmA (bactofilin family)
MRQGLVSMEQLLGSMHIMGEKIRFKNEHEVTLGHIKGDVEIENCQTIIPEKGKEIVIEGELNIRGDTEIQGSLKAEYLEIDGRNTSEIDGDLTIARSVRVRRGQLRVTGSATANKIAVGAALTVGQNLTAQKISIGGALKVSGDAIAEDISIGGAIKVEGNITAESLSVGGAAKCNTGKIGKVDVGGAFKAEGVVEIGSIDVGGAIVVGPGSKVLNIDVGGSFKSEGDILFEDLDVGGTARFAGDAKGKRVDVGGSVKAEKSLILTEKLDVGGAAVIGTDLVVGEEIEVGGSLEAGNLIEAPVIDVGGSIKAVHIKATKDFRIGRRGEVRGFVESPDITVSESSRGGSFYGNSIRVEERARVKNLYGREIYLERDVRVEGELQYTERFEAEPGVYFGKEPQQVKQLPKPTDLVK